MRRRFDEDIPMDEQTQDEVVTSLQVEMLTKKQLYRKLFTVVMLIPSPLFILAPHLRSHSMLAFQCLVCIIVSSLVLYRDHNELLKFNAILAALITWQVWYRLSPLEPEDVLWFVPVVSVLTCYILRTWFNEMQSAIDGLRKKKFKLKGA